MREPGGAVGEPPLVPGDLLHLAGEGVPAPPASHLLGLPGTIDLACRVTLTEVALPPGS